MKKFLAFFALTALVFSGCSDDDDNAGNGGDNGSNELRKISVTSSEVKNIPSSVSIDEVRFVVEYGTTYMEHDLLTAKWNGGFSMTLPETVPSAYLSNITSILPDYIDNDGVSFSSTAMVTRWTSFETYNDDDYEGYLYIAKDSNNGSQVKYMYSDRDVRVRGSLKDDEDNEEWKYDLNLKKGWNRVLFKTSHSNGEEKHEITTDLPSDLKWYFSTDYDE